MFTPAKPYNNLPLLPPGWKKIETIPLVPNNGIKPA